MQLCVLMQGWHVVQTIGDDTIDIRGMTMHSKDVQPGDLFVCVPGKQGDGHAYAQEAVARGAVALLVMHPLPVDVPQCVCTDTRRAAAHMAAYFYGYPSQHMAVIGVTGTNGKTTTTFLLEHVFTTANKVCGVMGTIYTKLGDVRHAAAHTTPDAIAVQKTLHTMRHTGADVVVMEVSSHALVQGRVIGVDFRSAVFTNLTHDHLDYHGTMEAYGAAKALLFSRLGNGGVAGKTSVAIVNNDDEAQTTMQAATAREVITYGVCAPADVRATSLVTTMRGTTFRLHTFIGETDIDMPLLGLFNVYNALAAVTVALVEGVSLATIRTALATMPAVEGRMQRLNVGTPYDVLVDYAHTPDGLAHVLHTLRPLTVGKLITVLGCGGDRDPLKRPLMGQVSSQYSDYSIITSDNPRHESPQRIAEAIEAGILASAQAHPYTIQLDRKEAIRHALQCAQRGDVLLIAGKGHETVQWIGDIAHPFDDRVVVVQLLQEERMR